METANTGQEVAETFEQVAERFPELDDAAQQRAAARISAGAEAQAAFAQESVILHLVRVYN